MISLVTHDSSEGEQWGPWNLQRQVCLKICLFICITTNQMELGVGILKLASFGLSRFHVWLLVGEIPRNCRIFGAWIQTFFLLFLLWAPQWPRGKNPMNPMRAVRQSVETISREIKGVQTNRLMWLISHDISQPSRSISLSEVNKRHHLEWRLLGWSVSCFKHL